MFFSFFLTGLRILIILTILSWGVFFAFVYNWAEVKVTFLVVPLLFAFKFFLVGLLLLLIISIVFVEYLPMLL